MVGDKGRMEFKERCEKEELRFRWDGGCEEACDARDTPEVIVAWGRGCLLDLALAGVNSRASVFETFIGTEASISVLSVCADVTGLGVIFAFRRSRFSLRNHLAFEFL
jgi:hypothetical protein